jgi:spore coat protein U-like protein
MSACLRLLAATIALLLPAAAVSAPVSAPSTGKATVLKSLSVLKQADLDFGELVVSGAGTAVIDPVSGTMTTTGPINPIGSTAHPATFTATGSRNSVVIIHVPSSPVTLTRVGGGGTMTVSDWTLDGKINRRIPANSAFNFSVGGTLNVGAAQAEGTYTGTFAVTVQYP